MREMTGSAVPRPMKLEVRKVTGAAHGERSPERLPQRNGSGHREWQTRAGTVDLQIPKRRRGSCFSTFLQYRRTGLLLVWWTPR